ncbi:branched-chain amino acid ABC transporter substrate-binding protein [Azospirillum picis]|uniref:Branched-chain amino acid transport system substrate-binding protein n=1 Tax=Azospirillum picis TaxID=488438 RepID=A0ABU0MM54_9PROT|nr:branched-chain amino acid ABC transporter substrate-binding protein [Azospirillum picis]MBP2300586.1 branched-chain amino acid transport system substrate-binding protein [Azospirillum picis]MDQ0534555.1 branched-chain amino acid transport system substrate-binding protein [Azospirillum picis]
MRSSSKRLCALPIVSVVALLAGLGAAQADIVIGLGTATTGPVAALGEQSVYGAKQAVADINAKGGVLGQKLVLKVGDDACDPRQAVAVANQFVREGVAAVVGHLCSGASIPAAEVYQEEGVVMVSPTATNPLLTSKGFPTIFRVCGRDDQQGVVAGDYLAKTFKGKNIAVLDDKQAYGKGLADVVAKTLEKAGVKVAYRGSVTAGERDFSALVTSLKDKAIDAVYYGGYHPELGLMVRQAQEQGLKPQFIAGDGLNNQEYWSITGPAGEGTLYTDSPSAASDPKAQELIASFRKAGLPEPGNFAFYSYAAVQVIAEGLQKSGSVDGPKLAKTLHSGSYDTVVGPIEFDKKGDVTKPAYVMYVWHDGNPVMQQAAK